MGNITMGPHRDLTLALARSLGCNTFVETGTYKGKTTRWAAANFDHVHTIERSEPFYERYHAELNDIGNISTYFGDSRDHLPKIVKQLGGEPAIYWLDSHWMGGVTAGKNDECPLTDELIVLSKLPNNIIIIDDARYFLSTPPDFHDASFWPTIFDIAEIYRDQFANVFAQVFHDNIFIVPRHTETVGTLTDYARQISNQLLKSQ